MSRISASPHLPHRERFGVRRRPEKGRQHLDILVDFVLLFSYLCGEKVCAKLVVGENITIATALFQRRGL